MHSFFSLHGEPGGRTSERPLALIRQKAIPGRPTPFKINRLKFKSIVIMTLTSAEKVKVIVTSTLTLGLKVESKEWGDVDYYYYPPKSGKS